MIDTKGSSCRLQYYITSLNIYCQWMLVIHNNGGTILRMTNILYSMNHCEIGSEGVGYG